jgi:hypothetical protein
MKLVTVLRRLILAEILLGIVAFLIACFSEAFLPEPFRSYSRAQSDLPWSWHDWLLVAWTVLITPLCISAWVGLWRGRVKARRLYSLSWLLYLPTVLLLQPEAVLGITAFVDTLCVLVSGAIFGLLYFSELRHQFSGGYGNSWKDSGYL